MDVLLDIIDLILGFIGDVVKVVNNVVFDPMSDPMYRQGFITALVVGFIVGRAIGEIGERLEQIQAFFRPSKLPATNPGPSGKDRGVGCSWGTFILLLAGVLAVIVAVALARDFFR